MPISKPIVWVESVCAQVPGDLESALTQLRNRDTQCITLRAKVRDAEAARDEALTKTEELQVRTATPYHSSTTSGC